MNNDELKVLADRFGKSMKTGRKINSMSLQDLADKVGSSKTYIWELEDGRANVGCVRAIKIAEALHLDVYFMYRIKNNILT